MIFDKLSNAHLYYGISKRIEKALKWLGQADIGALPLGKNVIDGDNIYANVSNADTKPLEQSQTETHYKYIDIQYVYKGEEYIGFLPSEFLGKVTKNDVDHDACFYEATPDLITTSAGYFMLVFPHDAHAPRVAKGSPMKTHKVVVKVKWPE